MTGLVGFMAARIELTYLRHYPFFYDPVAYLHCAAVVYERVQAFGPLTAAWMEMTANPAFPLRTVPMALLVPGLLVSPVGHMVTALPARKNFDLALARELVCHADNGSQWCAFFDEYSGMPSTEGSWQTGKVFECNDKLFTIHDSYWQGLHPNSTKEEICAKVYDLSLRKIRVSVAFDNPKDAYSRIKSPTSARVSEYMSARLKTDTRWW